MRAAPTDEPEVTDATRFVLFWEIRNRTLVYGPSGEFVRHDYGKRFRVKAVVSEAAYRAAHDAACGPFGDMTPPLDDHWWSSRDVAWDRTGSHNWAVHCYSGGYIDWY